MSAEAGLIEAALFQAEGGGEAQRTNQWGSVGRGLGVDRSTC